MNQPEKKKPEPKGSIVAYQIHATGFSQVTANAQALMASSLPEGSVLSSGAPQSAKPHKSDRR